MSEANKALVRRFFDEVCNGRKIAVADELFATNHVYHDPQIPAVPGPQGVRDAIAPYQQAFDDAHWAVDRMFAADGDHVVTLWTGTGTHTKEMMGAAPTNKKLTVNGIWIQRIAGGKIVESWNNWDTLGLLQQLGIVPAMASSK